MKRTAAATSVTTLISALLSAGLHWPLPTDLRGLTSQAQFTGGHIWALRQMGEMVLGLQPWSTTIDRAGFPETWTAAFVAWVPAVLVAPLQWLDPVVAYNIGLLLSPVLTALATFALLVRALRIDPWVAAPTAQLFAFCPYLLGVLASGQIEKAQLWALPLCMLGAWEAIAGSRRIVGLLVLWGGLLAGAFSDPSLVSFLPVGVGVTGFAALWQGREHVLRAVGAAAVGAIGCGLLLLPPLEYYTPGPDAPPSAYLPAIPPPLDRVPWPAPFAQPRETLLGVTSAEVLRWLPPPEHRAKAVHVTYLGLPLIVVALFSLLVRGPGRFMGWAMAVLGVTMALGPYLIVDGHFVRVEGQMLRMPAWLLEHYGYPTARSGMYYRAISIASLGLAIAAARALQGLPPRYRAGAAVAFTLLCLGDTGRVVSETVPIRTTPVDGREALAAMAADPAPGAVLSLPLDPSEGEVQILMRDAALHTRPTSTFPNPRDLTRDPTVMAALTRIDEALTRPTEEERRAVLADMGFRYVARRSLGKDRRPPAVPLVQALGPPDISGPIQVWRIGD